jgi:hypothetical protein
MTKPVWEKTLEQVLLYKTTQITKVSPRTGNEYTTDAIPVLQVSSTGSVEQTPDGKFRYSVVDTRHNFEYDIKAPNQVEVAFGKTLAFKNVCGGSTNFGGWYSAESVAVVQQHA